MNIHYFDTYQAMSSSGSQLVLDELQKKKNLLICAATGGSPTGVYENLVKEYRSNSWFFDKVRVLKLDEWGGISMTDPNSCHSYLKKNLIDPLGIEDEKIIAFNSEASDPTLECKLIQDKINKEGPIDLCILGLGKNGHLGFNEPNQFLVHCHIAKLSSQTLQHSMALSMERQPTFGMTIGMADILNARRIILLITGKGKREIITKFLSQKITRQLPASFLWLHHKVECLIDRSSC